MNLWTVYHNTKDFGEKYVARRFILDQPTKDHFAHIDIDEVRKWIFQDSFKYNQGMPYRLNRQPEDDKCIIEVWI